MEKEYTLLDKFFYNREEEMAEEITEDIQCLKSKLKNVRQEHILELLEELPAECHEIREQITEKLDDLIVNYMIKIAYYNKKYYKQGFKDAIALENGCRKIQ